MTELEEIDKLLKCPICFESLKTALMIINCSHTFCSLCIRKYLSYKNVCPVCNVATYDADLKNNRLVDDIVLQFTSIKVSDRKAGKQIESGTRNQGRNCDDNVPATKKDVHAVGKLQAFSSEKKDSIQCKQQGHYSSQEKDDIQTEEQQLSSQTKDYQDDKVQMSLGNDANQTDKSKDEKLHSGFGRFTRMKKRRENNQGNKLILDIFSPKRKNPREACPTVVISTDEEDFEDCLKNSNIVNLQDEQVQKHSRRSSCAVSKKQIGGVDTDLTESIADSSLGSTDNVANVSTDSRRSARSNKENSMLPGDKNGPVLSAISLDTTESLSHDEDSTPQDQTMEFSTVKMPCPVCGVEVNDQAINTHLDQCLASAEKKSSLRRSTPKRKHMTKLVYNIMSDKNLRKKLKEDGLSCKGDKQTLINRHREFVLMYNAECDSLNPRPVEQVIKELEALEKAKQTGVSSSIRKERVHIEKNSSPATIKSVLQNYEKAHKSQFDDLVNAARNSRKTKGEKSHPGKKSEIPTEESENEKPVAMATDVTLSHVMKSQRGRSYVESDSASPLVQTSSLSTSCPVDNLLGGNSGVEGSSDDHSVLKNSSSCPVEHSSESNPGMEGDPVTETNSELCSVTNSLTENSNSNSGLDKNSPTSHTLPSTGSSEIRIERTPKKVRRRIHRDIITSTPSPRKLAGLGCSPLKSPSLPADLIVPPSPGKCALFVEDSEFGSDTEDQLFKKINSSIDTFSEDDQEDDCQSDWPALSQTPIPREQDGAVQSVEVEDTPLFDTEVVHNTSLRSRHVSGLSVESGVSTGSDESSILWVSSPVTMKIGTRRQSERVKAGNEDQRRSIKDSRDEKKKGNAKRKRSTGSSVGGIAKRIKRRR